VKGPTHSDEPFGQANWGASENAKLALLVMHAFGQNTAKENSTHEGSIIGNVVVWYRSRETTDDSIKTRSLLWSSASSLPASDNIRFGYVRQVSAIAGLQSITIEGN